MKEHKIRTGPNFDYDNVKILKAEPHYKSRISLAVYNIRGDQNATNYESVR